MLQTTSWNTVLRAVDAKRCTGQALTQRQQAQRAYVAEPLVVHRKFQKRSPSRWRVRKTTKNSSRRRPWDLYDERIPHELKTWVSDTEFFCMV